MKTKKKRKKRSRFYFDDEVEQAIVKYNNETNYIDKNRIYNNKIKYAIEKLAENIINAVVKPIYIPEKFNDLKAEVVSHLILNLDKYDPTKGKAYSYFGQAARNYLIISNNNNYKKTKTDISIYECEENENVEQNVFDIEDYHIKQSYLQKDDQEFIQLLINYLDTNLNKIFKRTRDIQIANAIIQLLQNYDIFIENFNKKNLYILIREMTQFKAIHITRVLDRIKIIYIRLRMEYNSRGNISFNYPIEPYK